MFASTSTELPQPKYQNLLSTHSSYLFTMSVESPTDPAPELPQSYPLCRRDTLRTPSSRAGTPSSLCSRGPPDADNFFPRNGG
ncbi:uncharacterized protein N7459_001295 [Penicillium hispanicum]|uniref:uncharacterized protein n=1 Tax=Penicillium hispanicum TaxID=1080232 RepID=UPI00254176A1|nr:uncharacterized protein N7459_001295 [Penicillium hispanicum]KAJ5595087.1 hypothetical protein N7459_001295 [Penicillium hispanicum]